MNYSSKLIHGDAIAELRQIEPKSADLIVADPPYGIRKDFGLPDSYDGIDEWIEWCRMWLVECNRILKPSGSILVYGIHRYLCFTQVELYKLGLQYVRQIIWHYENGFCGNTKLPRATYEPLLWFSKSTEFYFLPIREPYKSQSRLKYKIKKDGKIWQPHPDGRIAGDVWNFPTLAGRSFRDEKVDHPTQKPLVICNRLMRHFCPTDGNVLIPFAGSGSECVSAWTHGRNFLGIELNAKYCQLAKDRLRKVGWRSSENNIEEVADEFVAIA